MGKTLYFYFTLQTTCGYRSSAKSKLPQIEIPAFQCEISIELVPTKNFVTCTVAIIGNRDGAKAAGQQITADPRIINTGFSGAYAGPTVPTRNFRKCRGDSHGG